MKKLSYHIPILTGEGGLLNVRSCDSLAIAGNQWVCYVKRPQLGEVKINCLRDTMFWHIKVSDTDVKLQFSWVSRNPTFLTRLSRPQWQAVKKTEISAFLAFRT